MIAKEKQNVKILISSCDKYRDAWYPFFSLIKINGKELCDYQFILLTESETFEFPGLDIKVINIPEKSWGKRMLRAVDIIEAEYIFLLLEDFFLDKPFNNEKFEEVLKYMECHSDIGMTHITQTKKPHEETSDIMFERKYEVLNIVITAAIYRKNFLKKVLRANDTPWDYETYAGTRAQHLKQRVMQYNEKYPEIFSYNHNLYDGTAIARGKWMRNTKQLFESYGIEVNYDNLGFYPDSDHIDRKIVTKKQKTKKQKGLREGLHFYRKEINKIPKRIKIWYEHIR